MGGLKKLKRHFLSQLEKGINLSDEELREYAKRRRWKIPLYTGKLKDEWVSLARFNRIVHRPRNYVTGLVYRMGLIQTDLAIVEEGRDWRHVNDGNMGFLVGVDTATRKVCAIPMRGKSVEDYKDVLDKLLTGGHFPRIHRLVSDNDRGIASPKVYNYIMERFGVPITYMKLRHKAYLAERMIREIRNDLSQALLKTGYRPRKWLDIVQNIVKRMNGRPGNEGGQAPKDVTDSNFYRFLDTKLGTDSTFFTNTSSIDSRSLSSNPAVVRAIWKLAIGDTVLVSAKHMPSEMRRRGRKFFKPTKFGAFFDKKFTIKEQKLRSALKPDILVPGTTPI